MGRVAHRSFRSKTLGEERDCPAYWTLPLGCYHSWYVFLFQGAAVTIHVIQRITIRFKYKGFKAIENSHTRTPDHERAYCKSYHKIFAVTNI